MNYDNVTADMIAATVGRFNEACDARIAFEKEGSPIRDTIREHNRKERLADRARELAGAGHS